MTIKPTSKRVTKPTAKAKYKSSAHKAIHTSANVLLKIGAVSQATMDRFEEHCLAQPGDIKTSRSVIYIAIWFQPRFTIPLDYFNNYFFFK